MGPLVPSSVINFVILTRLYAVATNSHTLL